MGKLIMVIILATLFAAGCAATWPGKAQELSLSEAHTPIRGSGPGTVILLTAPDP